MSQIYRIRDRNKKKKGQVSTHFSTEHSSVWIFSTEISLHLRHFIEL
jgi:hypothetical protein